MQNKIRLISTLPKSGTWYAHSFFWCYEQLLQHTEEYLQGTFKPDLMGVLRDKKIANLSTHTKTLGIDELFICHSVCPGFHAVNDARYYQWEALNLFISGYNWGEQWIGDKGKWEALSPARNPDARIVYLYRNPLDHFVSLYAHGKKHIHTNQRLKTLPDGTHAPINSLHGFVFDFGALGAFIKHYYSFKQTGFLFPEQVKCLPYEYLTTQPEKAFYEILAFMGAAPDTKVKQCLFEDALLMCSKESLMSIESKLDRSMVGDQMGNAKHIRDGAIGKWRNHFVNEDIERIESVFNAFDISLNDFTLTNDTSDLVPFSVDPVKKLSCQAEFFAQQLALTGKRIAALSQEITKLKKQIIILQQVKYYTIIARPWHFCIRIGKKLYAARKLITG